MDNSQLDDQQRHVEYVQPIDTNNRFIASWRPYVKYFPAALAWLSAAFGIMIVFGSVISPVDVTGIILGVGAALPGVWWIRCNGVDKKAKRQYRHNLISRQQLKMMLGDDSPAIYNALEAVQKPFPVERHWGIVSTISLVLMLISAIFS